MFRVTYGTAVALLFGCLSSATAQDQPTDFLGIDFTSTYSDEKRKIDTRIVGGQPLSLFQIDLDLQRQSYLVETDAGEICEFVTVTAIENAASPTESFKFLIEMRSVIEDLYGLPTESQGLTEGLPNQFTWLEGDHGVRLPPQVAKATLALGWVNDLPVVIFLKASHRRCAHISAFGLP